MNSVIKKALLKSIEIGSTIVDASQAQERFEVCLSCPNYGEVTGKVLGVELNYNACKLCMCPIETKVRIDVIASQLHLNAMNAYQQSNHAATITRSKNTCSDAANRWADIDSKYQNK